MHPFEKILYEKLSDKIKNNDRYAQVVYHSLCNTNFYNLKERPNAVKEYEQLNEKHEKIANNWWRTIARKTILLIRKLTGPKIVVGSDKKGFKYAQIKYRFGTKKLDRIMVFLQIKIAPLFPRYDYVYSCSWRTAGSIVAEIRNKGENYLNFYCSGNEGTVDDEFYFDMKEYGWYGYEYDAYGDLTEP